MPYSYFHSLFPETAEKETCTFTLLDKSTIDLPPAHYTFLEMYCDEPGCDCRRVLLTVVSSLKDEVLAVLGWGWEDQDFYVEWVGDDDEDIIGELKGPSLNQASPQSEHAPALLTLFREVLLRDSEYIRKIKEHYLDFRHKIESEAKKAAQEGKKTEQEKPE